MNAAGIIFSNLHDRNIPELTKVRTVASVPFACRYRLIDFPLSNMVNAGITNINIIANYNYHSLTDHIGTGKDWDLARRSGGIKILPPYINAYANYDNELPSNRLQALKGIHYTISTIQEEYVVVSDCDVLCNIDFRRLIDEHISSGADVSMLVKAMDIPENEAGRDVILSSDESGRICDVTMYSPEAFGHCDVSLNIWIMKTQLLNYFVTEAIAHNYDSFSRDIILRNIDKIYFRSARYDGYVAFTHSFDDYYKNSMAVIDNPDFRRALFSVTDRPVFTKVRNSPPTRYSSEAEVKNSLIADGCIINGTVENCIIFRGVRIGKGAVVKNSILFQDTVIGDSSDVECIVSDKNAVIRDGARLCGMKNYPIYIEKGRML